MPPYRDSDMIHMFGALMRTHDILLNRILTAMGCTKASPLSWNCWNVTRESPSKS